MRFWTNGVSIDIYIPISEDAFGYSEMFDDFYNYIIKQDKYSVKRENEKIKYKILLEPYITESYFKLDYKYRIKYKYSTISAKPNPVYKPELNICYDGIICFGEYEANYLSAYSKPLIVENTKYNNFNKKNNNNKPILLYLPTFGEHSSAKYFINSINNLKKEYQIYVKLHHGTSFLKEENNIARDLIEGSDKWYDQKTELSTLLEKVDVVLSDNSGSIFEAIYSGIPVAIFAKDINSAKLEGFETTQALLVRKDIIPYTDKEEEISKILKKALSDEYVNKQKAWREKAFKTFNTKTEEFTKRIYQYLNDEEDIVRYKNLHDILKNEYYHMKKSIVEQEKYIKNKEKEYLEYKEEQQKENLKLKDAIKQLEFDIDTYSQQLQTETTEKNKYKNINEELKETIQKQYDELEIYNNSKLYVLAKKMYKCINFIRRKNEK